MEWGLIHEPPKKKTSTSPVKIPFSPGETTPQNCCLLQLKCPKSPAQAASVEDIAVSVAWDAATQDILKKTVGTLW